MWEGDTYQDQLAVLKRRDGTFPPCRTGLTDAAGYDLRQVIQYAFARIGRKPVAERIALTVTNNINLERTEHSADHYPKQWAQNETNLRFLQWLICECVARESTFHPSATTAHTQADVIDYLTMELTGAEFVAPEPLHAVDDGR